MSYATRESNDRSLKRAPKRAKNWQVQFQGNDPARADFIEQLLKRKRLAAAQNRPAVTNSPANPVPPAVESAASTTAAHTGGVGSANSREHGPDYSRPPQEQALPRKRRASGPGHPAA